jgi:hypothetical protein
MTDVKTTLRSAYLAGPMRGIEDYNFPEFRKQTAWLRGLGWTVFSPAERDEQDPDIDHETDVAGWTGSRGLDYFMAHDLKAVCEMDAVICLPGWEASQGARLETVTAVEVGHPVFVIARTASDHRYLESVPADYVREVFAARGVPAPDLPVNPFQEDNLPARRMTESQWASDEGVGLPAVWAFEVEDDQGAMDTPADVIGQMEQESWEEWSREEPDYPADFERAHEAAITHAPIHAPFACQCGGALTEECEGYTPVDPPEDDPKVMEAFDRLEEKAQEGLRRLLCAPSVFAKEQPSALPTESAARKGVPLARGVLDYFPAALAEVARVSKAGNDKHNPGQDMHHARGKSTDHADCLLRHLVDRGKVDVETGQRHSAEVAWRALALLQQELEDEGLAPLPRGARLPEEEA